MAAADEALERPVRADRLLGLEHGRVGGEPARLLEDRLREGIHGARPLDRRRLQRAPLQYASPEECTNDPQQHSSQQTHVRVSLFLLIRPSADPNQRGGVMPVARGGSLSVIAI